MVNISGMLNSIKPTHCVSFLLFVVKYLNVGRWKEHSEIPRVFNSTFRYTNNST